MQVGHNRCHPVNICLKIFAFVITAILAILIGHGHGTVYQAGDFFGVLTGFRFRKKGNGFQLILAIMLIHQQSGRAEEE